MTVRRHVPLQHRIVPQVLVAVVIGAGIFWLWRDYAAEVERERVLLRQHAIALETQLQTETVERSRLAAQLGALEARVRVEQAASQRLGAHVKTLEGENARLKADLTYLESLLPAGKSEGPIAIRRFDVQPDLKPGQMRYRALLTQDARSDRDFEGSLQIVVTTESAAGPRSLTVMRPQTGAASRVKFRRYQRVEGIFSVPVDARVRSVQLRVFEGGTLRAEQIAVL